MLEKKDINFLTIILLLTFVTRSFYLLLDLPPYSFCDEMLVYKNFISLSENFKGFVYLKFGNLNIYPSIFFYKIIDFLNLIEIFNENPRRIIFFGRVVNLILFNVPTVILIYYLNKLIFGNAKIAKIGSIIFLLSPYIISNSYFWYPDSYVFFFNSLFLILILLIYKNKLNINNKSILSIGIVWGLSVSIKLTSVYLLIPFFLIINNKIKQIFSYKFIYFNFLFGTSGFLVYLLINFQLFENIQIFLSDISSHMDNYYYDEINQSFFGIVFYFFTSYLKFFGIISFFIFFVGYFFIFKFDKIVFFTLISFPIFLIIYLGSADLFVYRNMTSIIPFLIPVLSFGFYKLYLFSNEYFKNVFLKIIFNFFLLLPFIVNFLIIIVQAKDNFSDDLRFVAKDWIKHNIEPNTTIGVNSYCFGPSPAQINDNILIQDFTLEKKNIEYYVLTSDNDPFRKYYQANYSFIEILNQRNIHSLMWQNKKILISLNKEKVDEYFRGYEIVKLFKNLNGPDIIILRRKL